MELQARDRVNLHQLREVGGRRGFLLVRTVSPVRVEAGETTMVVAVTDPEASGKVNLSIKNLSSAVLHKQQVDLFLPTGTYLAMKMSPNHDSPLCWDNPSQIRFLSQKDVKIIMGQDFKWSLLSHHYDDPHSFWAYNAESGALIFSRLRDRGNQLFIFNCFSDAIRFYDLALQYASSDIETSLTLSNKAAALLRLGCYNAALVVASCAKGLDPGNIKAVYRAAQSHIGLGHYDKAVKELESVISSRNDDLRDLLKKAKNMKVAPSTPSLEVYLALSKLLAMTLSEGGVWEFPPVDPALLNPLLDSLKEYKGPVEIQDSGPIASGLFATQDLVPGQVLLVSRPLAFHQYNASNKTCHQDDHRNAMRTAIANKVHLDPSLGPLLYQLDAGEGLGSLAADDPSSTLVDIRRIEGILNRSPSLAKSSKQRHCGFWILPSFINHSCSDHNVIEDVFHDVSVWRATKAIPKGAEILGIYAVPYLTYEQRAANLQKNYGFTCTCQLWTWELDEKNSADGLRLANFKRGLAEVEEKGSNASWRQLVSQTNFVKRLWKEVGFYGIVPLCGLTMLMHRLRMEAEPDFCSAPRLLKKSVKIGRLAASASEHGKGLISSLINLHSALLLSFRMEEMLENLRALKEELVLWYGSVDGIRVVSEGFVEKLEMLGIDWSEL